jgi:hypothetical protein
LKIKGIYHQPKAAGGRQNENYKQPKLRPPAATNTWGQNCRGAALANERLELEAERGQAAKRTGRLFLANATLRGARTTLRTSFCFLHLIF